jgi:hypothetical protein
MKKYLYVALLAFGVVMLMAPPVMAQDEKPFVIHGEFRFRGEYLENTTDLNDDAADSIGFWPYRARLAAEGKFGKNIGVWIEFQNASVAGGSSSGPFRNGSDLVGLEGEGAELYQASVSIGELWSKNFSVRLGRQEIVAGNELLLGDLDFYTGISHDGLSGVWKFDKGNVMVWYTVPIEGGTSFVAGSNNPLNVIDGAGNSQAFYGAYATWGWKKTSFDAYAMNAKIAGTGFDVMTFGGRWGRESSGKGLFWNVEYALQTGDVDTTEDASGNALEGWIGYNFNKKHRVYVRAEQATGDDLSTGTDDESFQPMFGDFHNRTGHGDWFLLQDDPTAGAFGLEGGLTAIGVGWTGRFDDKSEVGVEYWNYALEEDNGAAIGDDLGAAIDVWYGYNYSRNLSFVAAFSQLSPDDALSGGGAAPDDSVTRLYGQARIRF